MTRSVRAIGVAVLASAAIVVAFAQELTLPLAQGSVRMLVIGDSGTGDSAQNDVARQMMSFRSKLPYDFAIMLGDNMYGSERPQDYARKFEMPFKPLLDAKVEFHAALGNHDDPNQRFYKPFGLAGNRYATFRKGNARFFALDSNYMDPEQVGWLEKQLQASGSDWKIAYFHHPLYTAATRGPSVELRAILEPIFLKYGVNVVFTGHEHLYERVKPQKGIQYFVAGGSAKLRQGDLQKNAETAFGYDREQTFMLVEIAGDALHFQTITRKGATVDQGVIQRQTKN